MTALDRDTGDNGQVVYTLTGSDKFVINSNTGIITASQNLNVARETYTCVVKAEDQVSYVYSGCFVTYRFVVDLLQLRLEGSVRISLKNACCASY